jgi:glutathione S-transferase
MLLYDYGPLAECYAVRLLAALLGVQLTLRPIEYYPACEHEEAAFLAVNPLGTLPVLDAGEAILRDWQAALVYLAAQHDRAGRWLPTGDAPLLAAIQEWLSVARQLADSAGAARLHDSFGLNADIVGCRAQAHRLLRHLERQLWFGERRGSEWLVPGAHPTIADVAVFVHVILCEEGGIERMDYPAVRRWTDRIRRLPNFLITAGVFPLPPLESVATSA